MVRWLCLAIWFMIGCGPLCLMRAQDAPASKEPAKEIIFREAVAIRGVVRAGRSAVHIDPVEALMVSGKFTAPKSGDELKLPDSAVRKWEALQAGPDGSFSSANLAGGYAFVSVPSDERCVMLLEASGHGMVYVNGEPRTGDPYSTGYVRLPVLLKKGDNEFLFQVGRGGFRAKLVPPRRPVMIDVSDATLPDLVVGRKVAASGAVVVINASTEPLSDVTSRASFDGPIGETGTATGLWQIPNIPPLSTRKVEWFLAGNPPTEAGTVDLQLRLVTVSRRSRTLDAAKVSLRVCKPEQPRKETFKSEIDGSVQYYAVTPMANSTLKPGEKPALFLTCHGAGVEALGQASCYSNKTWGHVVAPTNRRPYGFDWEDWGRLDAMEVLEHAQKTLGTDARRTYLTGHSMGGHGVWQLGALFPDRFAAIAPSAGWISMYSYAGGRRPENPDPRQEMLSRAAATSDTLTMLKNYDHHGIYVLHGDKDDNVPVGQAREMRKQLATFHSDFTYYERPGAGHWWGNDCVDWPPIFEFFQRRATPERKDVRQVDFTTVNPGVSARSHWATIEAQTLGMKPSTIRLQQDAGKRLITGSTENVARLVLDVAHWKPNEPVSLELDQQKLANLPWPVAGTRLWFARAGEKWSPCEKPGPELKNPNRAGPFKDAFRNHMLFVYGTKGTTEENAWAFAKARYDAELFWYRGNGSVEVIADSHFSDEGTKDRNIILYGNAATNAAWATLLKDCPVQVLAGELRVGDRIEKGDDLACKFLRPRPGSDLACVAAISGTGLAGMRLTDRIPYFVSGVGIPDLFVVDSTMLTKGSDGIRVAGFFGNDWSVAKGEFAWRP